MHKTNLVTMDRMSTPDRTPDSLKTLPAEPRNIVRRLPARLQENPMPKHQTAEFVENERPCDSRRVMNKLRNSKLAQAGFSLVELLVVIAVIAIIAGIAIPQITGARDAAVNARDAARIEERTRFANNVAGAGGPTLDPTTLSNGQTVSVTNVAGTNTNVITFTFTEN